MEAPSNANQGMECGCRVYFDGDYKVAYCATHGAAPAMDRLLRQEVATITLFLSQACALIAKNDSKEGPSE